jgi:cytochrome c oxidase subunit 4
MVMISNQIPSRMVYVWVYIALLALLGATVGVAFIEAGILNFILAMSIAMVKAVLVVLFFMHVRESGPLTRLFVGAGILWLLILIGLTLTDFLSRTWV